MSVNETKYLLESGVFDSFMKKIYSTDDNVALQKERYMMLLDLYESLYCSKGEVRFFSAPGRTEICGNHTDHNRGKVMAAAINLDAVAAAAQNGEGIIRVKSKEYPGTDIVDITNLEPVNDEAGTSAALIRGVARGFIDRGYKIGGFNAVTVTQVLSGSGLSSSAAFEVLIGTVFNYLFNEGKISPVEIAQIAQYSENVFFGKPCGLMDQMACSVGGFVKIDFKDSGNPVITPVEFDFASCGHSLCIVDTKASHADLTDEYGAIRSEMEAVAGVFGKTALRDVDENEFISNISLVRKNVNERAVLRAFHFFGENNRVEKASKALAGNNFAEFKNIITESGYSSYMYNQNVYSSKNPLSQPVSMALAISEYILKDKGAYRVHGGGFAGTIQAFVPDDMLVTYKTEIEKVLGKDTCYVLSIRPVGGCEIKQELK